MEQDRRHNARPILSGGAEIENVGLCGPNRVDRAVQRVIHHGDIEPGHVVRRCGNGVSHRDRHAEIGKPRVVRERAGPLRTLCRGAKIDDCGDAALNQRIFFRLGYPRGDIAPNKAETVFQYRAGVERVFKKTFHTVPPGHSNSCPFLYDMEMRSVQRAGISNAAKYACSIGIHSVKKRFAFSGVLRCEMRSRCNSGGISRKTERS